MTEGSAVAPDRGAFTLSLDFELIWGTLDLFGTEGFARRCAIEREVVVDRLLSVFEHYEVPATWLVVGHLFLDHCERDNQGRAHGDITRPDHEWDDGDWYRHDPCSTEAEAPLFYGRSLIERIRACAVPQEIGGHSFSHVIYGDPGCSAAAARDDLAASVSAAGTLGIRMRSFAFPRNAPGHTELLHEQGFTCFRGPDPVWYEHGPRTRIKRVAHLGDVLLARRPPVVAPERHPTGLWNIPGSMIWFPADGIRRRVPMALRVRRATKGLEAAAAEGRIFHLWFHPTNMADDTERMFAGLEAVLAHAAALRDNGELRFASMSDLVPVSSGS